MPLEVYQAIIVALLFLLVLVNGCRAYWKGVASEATEDGGWQDEAEWWRVRFDRHIEQMGRQQTEASWWRDQFDDHVAKVVIEAQPIEAT